MVILEFSYSTPITMKLVKLGRFMEEEFKDLRQSQGTFTRYCHTVQLTAEGGK